MVARRQQYLHGDVDRLLRTGEAQELVQLDAL